MRKHEFLLTLLTRTLLQYFHSSRIADSISLKGPKTKREKLLCTPPFSTRVRNAKVLCIFRLVRNHYFKLKHIGMAYG